MINIIRAYILVCISLFLLIMMRLENIYLIVLFSVIHFSIFVYSGYSTTIKGKKLQYLILGLIGLLLFVASLIISFNQLPNKNNTYSFIWTIVQLYVLSIEWLIYSLQPNFLQYANFFERTGFYLLEIIIIGLLPYCGALLREKHNFKKTAKPNNKI